MNILSSRTFITIFPIVFLLLACNAVADTQQAANSPAELVVGQKATAIDGGVMVVYQDQNGHYWFGGNDDGLYHYDGQELRLIRKEDGLCSTAILGIQEDRHGNLYFDTTEGICRFDGQSFTTLEVTNTDSTKHSWQSGANDLWFRMGWEHRGAFRYDGDSLYFLEFPESDRAAAFYEKYPNSPYNPYGTYSHFQDSHGNVWFGTASLGLVRFDGQSLAWLYEQHLTETPGGGDFGIRSIVEDKDGFFWFCNSRYKYRVEPENEVGSQLIPYNREAGLAYQNQAGETDYPYFMYMTKDKVGDLWMLTYDEGVYRNTGQELFHYPVQEDGKYLQLHSVYADQKGQIWVGTQQQGVYHLQDDKFVRKF